MLGPPNEKNNNNDPLNQIETRNLKHEIKALSFLSNENDLEKNPKSIAPLKEIVKYENISIIPIQNKNIESVSFKILTLKLSMERVLEIIYWIILIVGGLTVYVFASQFYNETSNYAMDINNRNTSSEELMMGIDKKICSLADMFYIDTKCQSDQDFCITFSNSMMSLNERLELLRDVFHWMPTVDGIFNNIYSLEAINNCTYFIGVSNYYIFMWKLNSNKARSVSIEPTSLIKVAPNEKFAILSGKEGKSYKFNITSFQVTASSRFIFDRSIYTDILISNDNRLIFLYCESKEKIYVELSEIDLVIQTFEGINRKLYKMILSEPSYDLIINDAVSVKIYFIHSNKPAYIIKNAQELKKFKGKYHELVYFEKYFAKGNYSVVS
ncbi:hypothetical protein SteCoe_34972 [Stentor coeruleus]|uniref:Uncharacterized protein n=1 Tax=Stentor coeruleus TaxID=5963 RepID=A0A1R2ATD0_9CILI|nr:hypothetical protein SteCoe_34972 [Stentor coeruleus]